MKSFIKGVLVGVIVVVAAVSSLNYWIKDYKLFGRNGMYY